MSGFLSSSGSGTGVSAGGNLSVPNTLTVGGSIVNSALTSSITDIRKAADGYQLQITGLDLVEAEHYYQISDALQTIRKDLDGYITAEDAPGISDVTALDAAVQTIRKDLDGYQIQIDNENTKELSHYNALSTAIQTIRKDCDGYQTQIDNESTKELSHYRALSNAIQTIRKDCDGYVVNTSSAVNQVAYYTGAKTIASSADFVYYPTTGGLQNTATFNGVAGVYAVGNGTGYGVSGVGGSTDAAGVRGLGGATNGVGVSGQGTGTGAGGSFTGGSTTALIANGNAQIDGYLYINAAIDTAKNMSLHHNGLDGYLATGHGDLWLAPNDGYVEVKGDLIIHGQSYTQLTTLNKPTGTTVVVNWNQGNVQVLSLASATGDVSISFTNAMVGGSYVLKIIQHASAAKNVIWGANCLFAGGAAPTITVTANAIDVVSLLYDGVNYLINCGQDYKRT